MTLRDLYVSGTVHDVSFSLKRAAHENPTANNNIVVINVLHRVDDGTNDGTPCRNDERNARLWRYTCIAILLLLPRGNLKIENSGTRRR